MTHGGGALAKAGAPPSRLPNTHQGVTVFYVLLSSKRNTDF